MRTQGLAKAVNAARVGLVTLDEFRDPFADRLDGRFDKENLVDKALGQAENAASDPQAFALLGAKAVFFRNKASTDSAALFTASCD